MISDKMMAREIDEDEWIETKVSVDDSGHWYYWDCAAEELANKLLESHEGSAHDFNPTIEVTDGKTIKKFQISADYSIDIFTDEIE